MSHRFHSHSAWVVLIAAVTACSSSAAPSDAVPDAGGVDSGRSDANGGLRAIPDEVLARRAIAYSGYRTGQSPQTSTYPSQDQIKEDLELLVRGGFTFLRLFDASPHAERVLQVIRDNALDIKVMLGVWIAGRKMYYDARNREQIDKAVTLAATYPDIVAAISVGNETLDDWSSVRVPPAELASYIREVRERVVQPVTTDDMYLPFTLGQVGATSYADVLEVVQSLDFLSIHVYAFLDAPWNSWSWQVEGSPEGPERATAMMKNALGYTKASLWSVHRAVLEHGLDLPMVIGEAGWKSRPTRAAEPTEVYRAHPVNQKMFYDSLTSWVYGSEKDVASPRGAFFFEAFDEPWKSEDDGWGLFDVERKAKYAMWSAFPDKKPEEAPAYTDADAVYYKPEAPHDAGSPDAQQGDAAGVEASAVDAADDAEAVDSGPVSDAGSDAQPTGDQ
jgi:exo-beta-1,3-glucanase (GH17 family)